MSAREHSRVEADRSRDYGYCNARVRGMWSRLLDRSALEELISARTLEQQIRLLIQTPYAADLEDALIHGHTVDNVDRALRASVARTWTIVLKVLPAQGVGPVKALLARWDIFDLKTILRGVHAHSSPGEIVDSLMPAATLADVELLELAKAGDVREVVDTLATWRLPYAQPLEEAFVSYRAMDVTAPLELALDRWYYRSVSERLKSKRSREKRLMRSVMGTMVDVENLRTALRLMGQGGDPDQDAGFFLEGGTEIGPERFSALCATEDVDRALEILKNTRYAAPLEDAAIDYVKEGTLSVLERALEDLLTREMLSTRRGDLLGLGVVISYLWAQQNEVSNIRVAITGREMGLPEERMRRELILV